MIREYRYRDTPFSSFQVLNEYPPRTLYISESTKPDTASYQVYTTTEIIQT
jgi:hypothetical protein